MSVVHRDASSRLTRERPGTLPAKAGGAAPTTAPLRAARPGWHVCGGRAFTLVELLVVTAILTILIALLAPSLVQARRLAVRAQCFGLERNILLALGQYLTEYDEQFPTAGYWWCYSPSCPGPKGAWFTRSEYDDMREGIGDFLRLDGDLLQCSAAAEHEEEHSWGLASHLPTYCVNRTIIPYGPTQPFPERLAVKSSQISHPPRAYVFADGDWRGVFQAFSLSYESTFERFFWTPHLDGTDVGYLDAHVEWVHSGRNIHPNDWPNYYSPSLDWCEFRDWAVMWR